MNDVVTVIRMFLGAPFLFAFVVLVPTSSTVDVFARFLRQQGCMVLVPRGNGF